MVSSKHNAESPAYGNQRTVTASLVEALTQKPHHGLPSDDQTMSRKRLGRIVQGR
jgi:hypothetical protein